MIGTRRTRAVKFAVAKIQTISSFFYIFPYFFCSSQILAHNPLTDTLVVWLIEQTISARRLR